MAAVCECKCRTDGEHWGQDRTGTLSFSSLSSLGLQTSLLKIVKGRLGGGLPSAAQGFPANQTGGSMQGSKNGICLGVTQETGCTQQCWMLGGGDHVRRQMRPAAELRLSPVIISKAPNSPDLKKKKRTDFLSPASPISQAPVLAPTNLFLAFMNLHARVLKGKRSQGLFFYPTFLVYHHAFEVCKWQWVSLFFIVK